MINNYLPQLNVLGWQIASHLKSDPAWQEYLLGKGDNPSPQSVVVEVIELRDSLQGYAHDFCNAVIEACLAAYPDLKSCTLPWAYSLTPSGWFVRAPSNHWKEANARLEEVRMHKAVILKTCDRAGDTLNAVQVKFCLPEDPSDFRIIAELWAKVDPLKDQKRIIELLREGDYAAKLIKASPPWQDQTLVSAVTRPTAMSLVSPVSNFKVVAKTNNSFTYQIGELAKALPLNSDDVSLLNRLAENDLGLVELFQIGNWSQGWVYLRLLSLVNSRSEFPSPKANPNRLIPIPDLKIQSRIQDPRPPIFAALVLAQRIQEAFPGSLGDSTTSPRVGQVKSLALLGFKKVGSIREPDATQTVEVWPNCGDIHSFMELNKVLTKGNENDSNSADYFLRFSCRLPIILQSIPNISKDLNLDIPMNLGSQRDAVSYFSLLTVNHQIAPHIFKKIEEFAGNVDVLINGFKEPSFYRHSIEKVDPFLSGALTGQQSFTVNSDHPLRLARFASAEMDVWMALDSVLKSPGQVREIPLTSLPRLDSCPAVNWFSFGDPTSEKVWICGDAPVPSSAEFKRFTVDSSAEPDLVNCLQEVFRSYAKGVMRGMTRSISLLVHASSDTEHALRPANLAAVLCDPKWDNSVTDGVDLSFDGDQWSLDALRKGFLNSDEQRGESDPFVMLERIERVRTVGSLDAGRMPLEEVRVDFHHFALMIRPFSRKRKLGYALNPENMITPSGVPVWDPYARSWVERLAKSGFAAKPTTTNINCDYLEASYQHLIALRRRCEQENSTDRRCLTFTTTTFCGTPEGNDVFKSLKDAQSKALRVIVADPVFSAEAIQPDEKDLMVVYAERTADYRLTILAQKKPIKELPEFLALENGLKILFKADVPVDDRVTEALYWGTHRRQASLLRDIWSCEAREDGGELIGHIGVALFLKGVRGKLPTSGNWPRRLEKWWSEGFPSGTICVSMDLLQGLTRTRKSRTRADFLALVPLPLEDDRPQLAILAIESKGSINSTAESYAEHGRTQAWVTREKMIARFGQNNQTEKQRLLELVASELYQIDSGKESDYLAVLQLLNSNQCELQFESICIVTDSNGAGVSDKCDKNELTPIVWIKGTAGLLKILGHWE